MAQLFYVLILSFCGLAFSESHSETDHKAREVDLSDRLVNFSPLAFSEGSTLNFDKPIYLRKSPVTEVVQRGPRKLQKNTVWATYFQEGKPLIPKSENEKGIEPDLTKPYCRIWPGPGQVIPTSGEVTVTKAKLEDTPEINYALTESGEVRGEIFIRLLNSPFQTIECHASRQQMTWKLVQEILGVNFKLVPAPFSIPTNEELKAVGRVTGPDVPTGTGTIVSGNYVLTAAHVVTKKYSKNKFDFIEFEPNFLARENIHSNLKVENHKPVKVEEVFIHPEYDPHKIPSSYDVAVLRLTPPEKGKSWEEVMGSFEIEGKNEKSPFFELTPLTAIGYPFDDLSRYVYPGRWGVENPNSNIISSQRAEAKNLPEVFYQFEKPKTPVAGVSGGPYVRKKQGKFKIAAIHVAGNEHGTENDAVNTSGIADWVQETIEKDQLLR